MSHSGEIASLTNRRRALLRLANQKLSDTRGQVTNRFKDSLLVGSNAIQTLRMLDNLETVADRKMNEKEDVTLLQANIADARQRLRQAVGDYEREAIIAVHAHVEQMTLANDPHYLEGEQKRRDEYLQRKRREDMARPTWTSNPSYRFVSLMKGDREGVEEVTEAEQRSCISKCAWGFAILGLIIAISFLIVDFWSAQANPALSTNVFHNDRLEMPTIYGCMSFPMIPTFEGLPNASYSGFPLWGLRSYTNVETNETYMFPKTSELITEPGFIGKPAFCEEALQYLSKEGIGEALDSIYDPSKKCYSCLRIGRKKPISLSFQKALKRASGAVTLEFAVSRDIDFCFDPYQARNPALKDGIKAMLKENGKQLVDKGMVTLLNNDSSIDISYALDFGFEDYQKAFPSDATPRIAAEATVYCNLYLFSGHFFPVKPGTEVKYTYDVNGGLASWKPVGDIKNFLNVEPVASIFEGRNVNRSVILNEIQTQSKTRGLSVSGTTVHIYNLDTKSDSPPAFRDFAASLRQSRRDLLLFTKQVDDGVSRYSATLQQGSTKLFRAAGRFRRYNVSLDFASFETERVRRRPTTSVAEFFTDVFEYIGLFTGVCAYSVLVSPARMYLKRSRSQR